MPPQRPAPREFYLGAMWLAAGAAAAFDVGDPSFQGFDNNERHRFEIYHEWMQRDVRLEFDRPLLYPAAGGGPLVGGKPPNRSGHDGDDQLFVRYVYFPVAFVALQADVGYAGESSSGDSVMVLGGAARGLLLEDGPFQLAAQVGAHFVPEFGYEEAGVIGSMGPYHADGEYDAYEYGAALIGSMTFDVGEKGRLRSYLGPRLSVYRGEMRSTATVLGTGDLIVGNGIAKQQSVFGLVIGTSFEWKGGWTARIEGRLIEEQSLSIGVGGAF